MSGEGKSQVQKLRREINQLNKKKNPALLESTRQLKDIKLRLYELQIFALTRKLQINCFEHIMELQMTDSYYPILNHLHNQHTEKSIPTILEN